MGDPEMVDRPFSFGSQSRQKLHTCHPSLQIVANEVIKISPLDFSIVCGHRGKEAQDEHFATGTSKVKWPDSKHNKTPSLAFDFAPWPLNWANISRADIERFIFIAGMFIAVGSLNGVNLRWGGNWDMDNDLSDEKFRDHGHIELWRG